MIYIEMIMELFAKLFIVGTLGVFTYGSVWLSWKERNF